MTIFCWLPPESARAGERRIGGTNVERRDLLRARSRAMRSPSSRTPLREAMLLAEDEVLGDRIVENQAARVAVLGNVRQPGVAARA